MGVMLSHAPWTFWLAGVPSWMVCLCGGLCGGFLADFLADFWRIVGGFITIGTALKVCVWL